MRSAVEGALLVLAATQLDAQQSQQVVLAPPACSACVVTLRRTATIGDRDGAGMLEKQDNLVRRDSRGRFIVFNGESPYFWVFDSAGRVVRRVGVRGQGPGEFESVTTIAVGARDTVFVFEARNRRMTVLAPDYTYVRAGVLLLTANFDAVALGNSVVINVDARARDGAQPLRFIGPDASNRRSFGASSNVYVPNQGYGTRRALTAAGSDAVLMAHLNRYAIERWDTAGRQTAVFTRNAAWFRPRVTSPSNANTPPAPQLVSLTHQRDTVWTILRVPGPNWRSVVTPTTPDGRFFTVSDEDVYEHTIIEAIDLRAGRVIVSTRVPVRVSGFLSPEMAYSTGTDADGNPTVVLWTVAIEQRPPR